MRETRSVSSSQSDISNIRASQSNLVLFGYSATHHPPVYTTEDAGAAFLFVISLHPSRFAHVHHASRAMPPSPDRPSSGPSHVTPHQLPMTMIHTRYVAVYRKNQSSVSHSDVITAPLSPRSPVVSVSASCKLFAPIRDSWSTCTSARPGVSGAPASSPVSLSRRRTHVSMSRGG
jgi:hypothetical protein